MRYWAWVCSEGIIWGIGTTRQKAFKDAAQFLCVEPGEMYGYLEEMTLAAYKQIEKHGYDGKTTSANNGVERRRIINGNKWYKRVAR